MLFLHSELTRRARSATSVSRRARPTRNRARRSCPSCSNRVPLSRHRPRCISPDRLSKQICVPVPLSVLHRHTHTPVPLGPHLALISIIHHTFSSVLRPPAYLPPSPISRTAPHYYKIGAPPYPPGPSDVVPIVTYVIRYYPMSSCASLHVCDRLSLSQTHHANRHVHSPPTCYPSIAQEPPRTSANPTSTQLRSGNIASLSDRKDPRNMFAM